jgi:hypothetical protein
MDNQYPINLATGQSEKFGESIASNFYQAINWLNLNLIIAEERILDSEIEMQRNDEFAPVFNDRQCNSPRIKKLLAIIERS